MSKSLQILDDELPPEDPESSGAAKPTLEPSWEEIQRGPVVTRPLEGEEDSRET